MKAKYLVWIFVCLLEASSVPLQAQPSEINQIADASAKFEAIKAKAEKGDSTAEGQLGSFYFAGIGVAKNEVEAARWFRKAAEEGDAHAQCGLGDCYNSGFGLTRDETEAAKWYRKAAENGSAAGQYALGSVLLFGIGVQQNTVEAIRWIQSGAKQGDAQSEFALGLCYALGNGVSQNYVEAYKWYSVAAAEGLTNAITSRSVIAGAFMTPEQIAKGQQLTAEFIANNFDAWLQTPSGVTAMKTAMNGKGGEMGSNEVAEVWNAFSLRGGKADTGETLSSPAPAPAKRTYTRQQYRKMLLTTPFFALPKDVQDECIDNFRAGVEKQGFPLSDAEIIHEYYRRQQMAQPPPDVQQYYQTHREKQEPNKLDSRQMLLTTPFFDLPGDVQDKCIDNFRAGVEKQGFPISDAEIIHEYYRRQEMALPPSYAQQNYGGQQEIPIEPSAGNSSTDSNPSATGTGFFVTDDGCLISNYHVVKGAAKVRLLTGAGVVDAKVAQVDAANDLALLKAEGHFAALPVASSRAVALGGTVATVGFPDIGLQGFAPKLGGKKRGQSSESRKVS